MELHDNTVILVSPEQFNKLCGEMAALRKHIETMSYDSGVGYASIKSVCKQLDCSKQFLYDLQHRGIITLHKLGNRTFISLRELEEAIVSEKRSK